MHIPAGKRGKVGCADDVAARDRAVTLRVRPHEHRRRVRGRRQRLRGDPCDSLERVPAVEGACTGAARREVDFLPGVLADVGEHEVPGRAVEREAPGVAQAVGPDLRARAADAGERVARRDRIRSAGARVDAEQLAEQAAEVLGVLAGVVAAAAVPGARVEEAVGAELQLAAPVVRLAGMGDAQEEPSAGRVGATRIGRGAPVLGDLDVHGRAARGRGARIRVEETGGRVVRRERDREQAALAVCEETLKLQERLRLEDAVAKDADTARFLDHVETRRVSGGGGDVDRLCGRGDPDELRRSARGSGGGESGGGDEHGGGERAHLARSLRATFAS